MGLPHVLRSLALLRAHLALRRARKVSWSLSVLLLNRLEAGLATPAEVLEVLRAHHDLPRVGGHGPQSR